MTRYGLRDHEWDRTTDLLPSKLGEVGATARDNRRFVEAVLCRYRTGIPWRDLPERFGDWKNTHRRFSRWAKAKPAGISLVASTSPPLQFGSIDDTP